MHSIQQLSKDRNIWMRIITVMIMVIIITVLTITLVAGLTYTVESTLTPSASPHRFSDITISVSNNTLEKYFNITKDRINDTTWKLTISI